MKTEVSEDRRAFVIFGDGNKFMSILNARVSVEIGISLCYLDIWVVPGKLPLVGNVKLLGKMGSVIGTFRKHVTLESLDSQVYCHGSFSAFHPLSRHLHGITCNFMANHG